MDGQMYGNYLNCSEGRRPLRRMRREEVGWTREEDEGGRAGDGRKGERGGGGDDGRRKACRMQEEERER